MEKINGNSPLPLSSLLGQGQAQVAKDAAAKTADLKQDGANATSASHDRLTIDHTAQQLRLAEATMDSKAPIDSEKVAQIRQAIADGSYQVNAGRIAGALIATEKSLYGK